MRAGPHTDAAAYRSTVEEALDANWRFAGLHAAQGGSLVRALLVDEAGTTRLETLETPSREAVSLVDLAPAGWDEREAFDLYGVTFPGHEPLRSLVDHEALLSAWTVPMHGRDAYQVAVGPIHAGVIESGHFRFHVVGDLILQLDARLFYKHRGLEGAAVGRTLDEGAAFVARACAACAVANGVAYAHACEEALGLAPTAELARSRTILLELERTWNHLNDIGAVCAGTGLAAGNNFFAALTEQARRLNERLTGHRFLFGSVRIGGSDIVLDRSTVRAARDVLSALRREAELGWQSLLDNLSFQDRLPGIGVLTPEEARRLGTVGPALRAAGIGDDVRSHSPRLAYEGFEPASQEASDGDVRARLEQRMVELRQSIDLLERLLERELRPAGVIHNEPERAIGVGRIESPRGETSCIVERNGDRIERIRLRTGSYANWATVASVAAGNLLPDFPLINKSFELCYACVDR